MSAISLRNVLSHDSRYVCLNCIVRRSPGRITYRKFSSDRTGTASNSEAPVLNEEKLLFNTQAVSNIQEEQVHNHAHENAPEFSVLSAEGKGASSINSLNGSLPLKQALHKLSARKKSGKSPTEDDVSVILQLQNVVRNIGADLEKEKQLQDKEKKKEAPTRNKELADKPLPKVENISSGRPRRAVTVPSALLKAAQIARSLNTRKARPRGKKQTPPLGKTLKSMRKAEIQTTDAASLRLTPIEIERPPVPTLSYGLERVLFNPGVYTVQDPRSRVFNFDPYLQTIMPVSEFNFNALKQYVTSSKDTALLDLAKKHGKRYTGSTSSTTGVLAHFHFLLSQWREVNTSMLSRGFPEALKSFTLLQRGPSTIFLKWKDGTYAIDADKEFASASVLSLLGKSMEKLLTLDKESFERYRVSSKDQISQEERNEPESFHYSTLGNFLLRSQLDAYDPRLPGTGMFDLKTRSVVTVRMDTQNFEIHRGYEIKDRYGEYESYEREYFDMIRAAFLKYSLQVRMGRMDGIFVAFHNTERIFGFQYISLEEMDLALHGQSDTILGDQEFKLSLDLLGKVLDKATQKFPEQSLRIHFETRESTDPFMYIFAKPVSEEEMTEIQSKNDAKISAYEREVMGLTNDETQWNELQARVQETVANDELGFSNIAETAGGLEGETCEDEILMSTSTRRETSDSDNSSVDFELHSIEEHLETDSPKQIDNQNLEVQQDQDLQHEKVPNISEQSKELGVEPQMDCNEVSDPLESVQSGFKEVAHCSEENLAENSESREIAPNPPNEDLALPETVEFPAETEQGYSGSGKENSANTWFLEALKQEMDDFVPNNEKDGQSPLLALTLTIRNKVDGKYVVRPMNLSSRSHQRPKTSPEGGNEDSTDTNAANWTVEYAFEEISSLKKSWALYESCQNRRKALFEKDGDVEDDEKLSFYLRRMRELSEKGSKWRKRKNEEEEGLEVLVLGSDGGGRR